jgi:hypothetical protein
MLKSIIYTFAILSLAVTCMAGDVSVRMIGGQAEFGTIEVHGVGAGDFDAKLWQSGKLNIVPDLRSPLIAPRLRGLYRNIYAPSIVDTGDGWRVFYGAWDGVDSGNDRTYSLPTADFVDLGCRQTVIEHGVFDHVCNVNALRLPDGSYRLMCTAYPDKDGLNKPATFASPDGSVWNGSPAPYEAKLSDIISIDGYEKYKAADINGMNVILYEDGVYRLYFNNFKDFGRVYRATSKDGKQFTFDGPAVEVGACVNDVKKFTAAGKPIYLMGLHMNGDKLWYALSTDGMEFDAPKDLAKNLGDADRYMVAIGWVTRGNRVLGFLYGAGAVGSLDHNRIFGRWLQKKVVFVASDGTRYEPSSAMGPDRQIIKIPQGKELDGTFEVYAEDGVTLLGKSPGKAVPSAGYMVEAK